MNKPLPPASPSPWDDDGTPVIAATGFREYDVRWRFPEDVNLSGIKALGLGLGTQIQRRGMVPEIVVGHDYRAYAPAVAEALTRGLIAAGIHVRHIGMALSPMAYFARDFLDVDAVAMVTASHNPNGWTGVKMGLQPPLTHGPDEMAELRDIVLNGTGETREGGKLTHEAGLRDAYLDDLAGDFRLTRPLKVVCATGNGTAGAFAPDLLRRIGARVVPLHAPLDYDFPNYNPNPEAMEMLHDMARATDEAGADFAVGFDGDGDRCGVVDDEGEEIFADKLGVIMARSWAQDHPGATIVADVKSTGLFASDPELKKHGIKADYWKTGHSYMKRRVHETGALAGIEKSGHYYLAAPIGRGYDCGLRVAVELCKLVERNPGKSLSDLRKALPRTWSTPTMSPFCPDDQKYGVLDRIIERLTKLTTLGGRRVQDVVTVNGARVILENGAWGLVRASSNTPNLVVVCESPDSEAEMRAIFDELDAVIRTEPSVGAYDQTI